MTDHVVIPTPSPEEVKRYLELWDSVETNVLKESSLRKLFTRTYPLNTDLEDVLIKVCALNGFYGTNIFSPFPVAKHIIELNIDTALAENDLDIVNKLATNEMNGGKIKNFYSFATKYCNNHKPTVYPIYDFYVEKILIYFRNRDNFSNFKRIDLKLYPSYKNILIKFTQFYGLGNYDLKKIDKYLWQIGKENFLKTYK